MKRPTILQSKLPIALYTQLSYQNGKEVAEMVAIEPRMKATLCCVSDRYPYEVVSVIDSKTITVRRMKAILIEETRKDWPAVEYTYECDPTAALKTVRQIVRSGRTRWVLASQIEGTKRWDYAEYSIFHFGYARYYTDPHV